MSNHAEHVQYVDVCDTFETKLPIILDLRISSGKPGGLK